MKKKDWKRSLAFVCATALIAGSLSEFGPLTRVKAEETNLFTDGDMGDDEMGDSTDAADFWANQKWYFEGDTWNCTSQVKYSIWAKQAGGCGLEIDFDKADGTVCMYQEIGSLEAGSYTVTGYIKDGSGSDGTIALYHATKDSSWNVSEKSTPLTKEYAMFTDEFTVAEAVSNYKVGFQITSKNGAWIYIDTLTLTKKASDSAEETPAPEATESPEPTATPEASATPAPESKVLYSKTFEEGTDPADMSDWSQTWSVDSNATSKADTGAGNNTTTVWNYYSATAQNLTAATTVTASDAGNYKASFLTAGENVTGTISLTAGDRKVSADLTAGGWDVYTLAETDALTVEAGAELTITISLDIAAGGYLKIDDILVTKASDAEIQAAKKAKAEELQSLITEYKALKETDYTADSWKALQEALTESENFLQALDGDYTSTTVTEIEEKITNLKKAKDELKSAAVVKAGINVEKVNGLTSDFIGGVDISSYRALKDSGVKYYDFAGNKLDDAGFFKLLKDSGINYVRIRVWNNPYDASGNGYGGGNNDLQKAVDMGKLATEAGMRVLIDFHYSDFWADPGKQKAPKAWADMTIEQKTAAVKEYTMNSLNTLLDAGVDVGMVQVGNETNNGIAGESGLENANTTAIFLAGCEAIQQVEQDRNREIKAVVHFANPEKQNYMTYAKALAEAGVEYDVFASSYYPYWHGTLDNLKNQLNAITENYGKEVMVAETSWATGLEDSDGHANTVREGNNDAGMDYDFSIYGQAKELREVINAVAEMDKGIGVFYWEPAWIPVKVYDENAENAANVLAENKAAWEKYGSGWAASYAKEYDAEDAGKWYGGSAIDNQALFDASGHPLETLKIFSYVKTGAETAKKISTVKNADAIEIELGSTFTLPETVKVTYSDYTSGAENVTWNAQDVAAVDINAAGKYTVNGTVSLEGETYQTKCVITVNPQNLLTNPRFEDGENAWILSGTGIKVLMDGKDSKDGNGYLHFYNDSDFTYDVTQTITLDAGIYRFGGYLQGGGNGEADSYEVYVSVDGKTQTEKGELNGWKNWSNPKVQNIEITKDGTKVTVGIRATASAGAWGSWDDMYLNKTGEVTPAPVVTPQPTATPAPIVTPQPTETPAPVVTPQPTETPAPVVTPQPTVTPAPATAPEVESSSADKETSAPVQTVDWNTVTSNVQAKITEVTQNPNINSVNMNIVCSGETRLPAAVLGSIKGSDVTLALHSGNGVAVSISGQDLKGTALNALQNIDLTVDSNARNIPAAMAASKKAEAVKQLSVKDTGAFPVAVNIHVSVGAENSGKYANLYRYNAEKKQLEYCGSFPVTRNGQSMFALKQGGDYMVTVTAAQPKETVYFNSGDYAVKAGDTLSAIARRNHMTLAELKAKNPQIKDLHKIRVGQKVNLN